MPSSFFSYDSLNSRKANDFYVTSYAQGQRSMWPKPRISFFWFTSIGVQKRPVLIEVLTPTRLALQGSHVQRLYQKQTPLHSKSSTIKGLLHAHLSSHCELFLARKVCTIAWAKHKKAVIWQATHAICGMGTLKIPLRSICSKESPHYCLGAKHKEAVIRQATNAIYGMGTLKIPLWSIRSKEGPHYRLGAKRMEAVIRQATINLFTSLDIPLVIPYPG